MTIQSRFECPTHEVPLILSRFKLTKFGRTCSGVVEVTFWKCPVNGCKHAKPCKHGRKIEKRGYRAEPLPAGKVLVHSREKEEGRPGTANVWTERG